MNNTAKITFLFLVLSITNTLLSLNPEEERLLEISKQRSGLDEAKKLLSKRVSPNVEDTYGYTPLYYACLYNPDISMMHALIDRGASVDKLYRFESSQTQLTLLQILTSQANALGLKRLKIMFLLSSGADPNVTNSNGDAPLYFLTRIPENLSSIYQTMKRYNANLDNQNKNGNTALHEAVKRGNEEAVKTLVELGASTTIKNKKGESPLDLASKTQPSLIQYLLPKPTFPPY